MKEYLLIDTETNRCYAQSIIKDDKCFEHMREEYPQCRYAQVFEFDDAMENDNHQLISTWIGQGAFAQCVDRYKVDKVCKLLMLDNMDTLRKCGLVGTEVEKIIQKAYNLGYQEGFHYAVVNEEEEEE